MRQEWQWLTKISILALTCLVCDNAYAGSLDKYDFSLRFPAALSRFSTYGDVAGLGGASAGSKWQSSTNPAGMAWEPMPPGTDFTASPQFSTIGFDNGTRLNVYVESLAMDGGDAGRFVVSVAQARSNTALDRAGLDFGFDLDLGRIAWGKRLSQDWAVGLSFGYSQSHSDFGLGPVAVAHSADQTYSGKAGVHYEAAPGVHLGLVVEEDAGPSKTDYFDFLGIGIGTIRVKDTTWQTMVRPGIAFEYAQKSTIYVDYQYARLSNNTGTLTLNRFFAGVEQRIFDSVYLRGGSTADARGKVGWTAGVGFYPTSNISLDFGYQDNNFPEVAAEFGGSQTFTASASISF